MPSRQATLPALRVQGNRITNGVEPVVLKGVNIADPEHIDKSRPVFRPTDVIERILDDLACSVIRIPVLPVGTHGFGFLEKKTEYLNAWLNPVVSRCAHRGMYAIVDMHFVDEGMGGVNYLQRKDAALEFWEFMAPKYRDNPHVIYEIYNEPVDPDDWSTWKDELAQPLVDLIRNHAPDNLLLVGGPDYCLNLAGAAADPVIDPKNDPANIAYVTHSYPEHRSGKRIAEVLDPIVDKLPVFVTEWGFEEGSTGFSGTGSMFGKEVLQYLDAHQLSWTAWNYDTLWEPKMLYCDWLLNGGDGRMGRFVADAINGSSPDDFGTDRGSTPGVGPLGGRMRAPQIRLSGE